MSRVAVKPDILRWARDRAGMDVDDLRQKFPKIDEWEAEHSRPTLKQLEAYARATHTPFGYFFLAEPPEEKLPIPYFRTGADAARKPSANLLDTVQTMQRHQDWLREELADRDEPPVEFVGAVTMDEPVEAAAAFMRDALGFTNDWARRHATWTAALQALRGALDSAGVVVVTNGVVGNNTYRKLDPQEFRGFVLVDERAPLVFVNGADAKTAQMFTLAHEMAHLCLGRSAAFDLKNLQPANDATERMCNAVAAEFLCPAADLRQAWEAVRNLEKPFDALARRFKVSAIVAARRALDLRLIARDTFFEFYNDHIAEATQRRADKSSGGGDFYLTQNVRLGRRFAVAVVNAAQEGRLAYREAYALTGLWGQTFDKFAAELQGKRRQ